MTGITRDMPLHDNRISRKEGFPRIFKAYIKCRKLELIHSERVKTDTPCSRIYLYEKRTVPLYIVKDKFSGK